MKSLLAPTAALAMLGAAGAQAEPAMSHIAIQEVLDGKAVEWLEQVSDERYGKVALDLR